ncbi:hypothetical protein CLV34_1676 [Luteimicrobium subarcticum]|uniref:Uncharacterized protein n=1 Tax=Luteimicrobium subarcticum TaxID=620910 RepID=A0A2M8WTI3_9MICO|nr:hypothetical protein CLV34_1676 [Luteimicrobium subarcticum]
MQDVIDVAGVAAGGGVAVPACSGDPATRDRTAPRAA